MSLASTQLHRRGAEVTFVCRSQPGDLIHLLREEFNVLSLPYQSLVSCEGQQGSELYSSWLGCSQDSDAAQCLELLSDAGITTPSLIIVDHYGLDIRWENQLLMSLTVDGATPQLLVIDDLADRVHQATYLLDQNYFGTLTEIRYSGLVPNDCSMFLGPEYALLSPEYALLHPLVPPRTILQRILVYFGSVNSLDLISSSLDVLTEPQFSELSVDVVVGQLDPNSDLIEHMVSHRPNTTLHTNIPSLAGLIARADLSIGSGGSTTWERLCLRLPSLVVITADNQSGFTEALANSGYIRLLVNCRDSFKYNLRKALVELKSNLLSLKSSDFLLDGYGASNVAKVIVP